jgi:hypothetical protein
VEDAFGMPPLSDEEPPLSLSEAHIWYTSQVQPDTQEAIRTAHMSDHDKQEAFPSAPKISDGEMLKYEELHYRSARSAYVLQQFGLKGGNLNVLFEEYDKRNGKNQSHQRILQQDSDEEWN